MHIYPLRWCGGVTLPTCAGGQRDLAHSPAATKIMAGVGTGQRTAHSFVRWVGVQTNFITIRNRIIMQHRLLCMPHVSHAKYLKITDKNVLSCRCCLPQLGFWLFMTCPASSNIHMIVRKTLCCPLVTVYIFGSSSEVFQVLSRILYPSLKYNKQYRLTTWSSSSS